MTRPKRQVPGHTDWPKLTRKDRKKIMFGVLISYMKKFLHNVWDMKCSIVILY